MMAIEEKTGLDILRTRGTPIEMIGSALAAGDLHTANATFRTTILEYLYEKIAEFGDCKVTFINSRQLKPRGDATGIHVDNAAAININTLRVPQHEACTFVPTYLIKSSTVREGISDHIQSTVMAVLECVSGDLYGEIDSAIMFAKKQCGAGKIEVQIVVDLFEFVLQATERYVMAQAEVPVLAFWTAEN